MSCCCCKTIIKSNGLDPNAYHLMALIDYISIHTMYIIIHAGACRNITVHYRQCVNKPSSYQRINY